LEEQPQARLAPILTVLTLARLMINGVRRFPYVILTPMAEALGMERAALEYVLSAQWAVTILSPFAGIFIDRIGRKRMMLIGLGILTLCSTLAALGQSASLIVFALLAGGLSKIFYDPAMQAYIGDNVPYQRRGMAIGVTELAWSGSLFVMGPLAAFLIAQVTLNAIFVVIALGSGISLILLIVMLPAEKILHSTGQPFYAKFGLLRANRSAVAMVAVAMLMSIGIESMSIVYEAWLRNVFLMSTIALGTLSLVFSAAEVTGEGFVIAVSDKWGKRLLVIAGLGATGILCFLIPYMQSELLSVGGLFLMFLAFEIAVVAQIPLATEVLPEARGTMLSMNIAGFASGRALGTLLGGWLFRSGGYGLNGLAGLMLNLIAAAIVWRFVVEHQAKSATETATIVSET
jgi:DHA1 family inner membrane transport protein